MKQNTELKRLGISIYPEKTGVQKTIKYLSLAWKYNFKKVFGNLITIKNNKEGVEKLKMVSQAYNYAKKLGFEVILDTNRDFYETFKLKPTEIDFFKNIGATGIRLDEDFGGTTEFKISQNKENFKLELNASLGIKTVLQTIKLGGNVQNIITCHNFYPMEHSGLDKLRFIELSSKIQSLNVKVAAFITPEQKYNTKGPWNVNEGLCTIEEHRYLPIVEQLKDLLVMDVIDDICIGSQLTLNDAKKVFKELNNVMNLYQNFLDEKILKVKVNTLNPSKIEKDIIFNNKGKMHYNRPDFNGKFFRSTYPRIDYANEEISENNAGRNLKPGDLVILNDNIKRYKGELHILNSCLSDKDKKIKNLVGKINKSDVFKLKINNHFNKPVKFIE